MSEKIRENYLRRRAKRLGLTLEKSRAFKWHYDNQQGYRIYDAQHYMCLHGERYQLTLDDVASLLDQREKELRG